MANNTEGLTELELEAVIGFNGNVCSGLNVHPDGEHLIYPLGSTVILKSLTDGQQEFLHGHTNNVSCISVSNSGSYIASGQVNFMGFEAPIIIWDYAQRTIYAQLSLHKTKVEALAFSPNEQYLASLGGKDDGSIIVWHVEEKKFLCGSPASANSSGHCFALQYSHTNNNIFVCAGSGTLRVWELDLRNRIIMSTDCQTGKLRRIVKCLEITKDDQFMYCGTTSGDVMKINLDTMRLAYCGPLKTKYSQGVTVLKILKSGDLLLGSGSGTITLCSSTSFKIFKNVEVEKGVTSIALRGEGNQFFVGTEAAQMYSINDMHFKAELVSSSHTSAVNDVAIPFGTSELFATCSEQDIRLWHIDKPKELLRITVPHMACNALDFMANGQSIISAWSDGDIRMFGPESGRLMLIINKAHKNGVTAIAGTRDSKRIISGGGDGQVRVWELLRQGHQLLETMTKHKGPVTCIQIKSNDRECVTTSADGSCIIWDIVRFMGLQMMATSSMCRAVCYHPEEHQIITTGANRKVTYWDVYDGAAIREVEGSQSGPINAMHISPDGQLFVTGGDDKLVKVWDYMRGVVTHVGVAHGVRITNIKICSNSLSLFSTSADGAVLRWRFPRPPSSSRESSAPPPPSH